MKKICICALMAVLVLSSLASESLALDVRKKILDNGLTVLHVTRDNLPIVMVTLLVKTGSVDEPPQKAGLASLTARLLPEGTKSRSSTKISEEIEFIGADLGTAANADYSTLTLSVLKKYADKGFEIFGDVLLNPVFPDEEIQRKKELTKASLIQREEDPSFLARRAYKKEVYGHHPYGRIVAGSPESIDAITREDIVEFYSRHFLPNNSILSVVGDLTGKELDRIIETYLDGWEKKPVPQRERISIPAPSRAVVRIDRDLTQANILFGHLGVKRDNPDYYALSVMNYILGGGGFSSRLMDSIRDRMGLAYSVYSSFSPARESGSFSVSVQTKNASANRVIEEILSQIRALMEEKVTEKELDDAKSYLTGSFPRRLDTMGKIANFLSLVEFYGLGLDYPDKYKEYIGAVTREEILRVARKYLYPDKYVLVVVANQSEADIHE